MSTYLTVSVDALFSHGFSFFGLIRGNVLYKYIVCIRRSMYTVDMIVYGHCQTSHFEHALVIYKRCGDTRFMFFECIFMVEMKIVHILPIVIHSN